MIWITANVDEKEYKEPFSKGKLSQSLKVADIGIEEAYNIAITIEEYLVKKDVTEISNVELEEIILEQLDKIDKNIAEKYGNWRLLRKTEKPLIILIGGASGVGTSTMAFELANKLNLKNIIGTDAIREVMRKTISKEVSPVIHKSSYDAYKSIRIPSIMIDSVMEGFISHIEIVNVGIEAIIERSVKEGISTIIEGVHIVPGFIRKDLLDNNNIIMFTLKVDDEEQHKQRFYSRCRKPWVKRSLDSYMKNFDTIRKTQRFLIEQSKINDTRIINNVNVNNTLDIMVSDILDKFQINKEDNQP